VTRQRRYHGRLFDFIGTDLSYRNKKISWDSTQRTALDKKDIGSAQFVVRVVWQWRRHEKAPDGLYCAYCPFGALIDASLTRRYHGKFTSSCPR
jgi:hypothetical protein